MSKTVEYASRRVLEDAISDYVQIFADHCDMLPSAALTVRAEARMMAAIDAHEAALRSDAAQESEGSQA